MILFALRFCRRVHRRVLAPAQSVDLVTQEGRVFKLQQLRRFLHLTGQALDGASRSILPMRRVFSLAFSAYR